jgi:putative ABC transport system substrate-binding protein
LTERRADGLVISADPLFAGRSAQLAALALHQRIPTVFEFRQFVAAGGLMSYGGSLTDAVRAVGHSTPLEAWRGPTLCLIPLP